MEELAAKLQELYVREYPNGEPFLYERLLPKLPLPLTQALMRRKLNLIVQEETDDPNATIDTLTNGDKLGLSMFLNPQVRREHLEASTDATLSTPGNEIAHYEAVAPLISHDLIWVGAQERLSKEALERTGCVFFDVDGMKTIVDCTSHAHACAYLQRVAFLLRQPPQAIVDWLKEQECSIDAYTVGGDEFVTIVRSETRVVDQALLDSFSVRMQEALAADTELASHIDFDDEHFLATYCADVDPKETRGTLPDRFTPSFSCGSATLIEGLEAAFSAETEASETLEELGFNTFRQMVDLADERMSESKRAYREAITDPRVKGFLLRNDENRRLENENAALRAQIEALLAENAALKGYTESV